MPAPARKKYASEQSIFRISFCNTEYESFVVIFKKFQAK